mmetsp:Transcript_13782/g.25636  ORF Transcript_13782/g.25636 Transcript_13782/m.25636 type:complete len:517 (-) Transcript_13782:176-1726(-)
MSFAKVDPIVFRASKNKPVHHVTVPVPGAFTISKSKNEITAMLAERSPSKNANHITIKTREKARGSQMIEQQERLEARNQRAIQKHKALHTQANERAHPKSRANAGGGSTGASMSTACLSSASQKAVKERELADKLKLLKRLREKDREISEAAELASSLLKKKDEELRASQQEGLDTLASVQSFLSSLPPPPPPGSDCGDALGDGDGEAYDDTHEGVDKFEHRDSVRKMMKGTAANELPDQGVNRVVVTRKLSRRQSAKLENSFGQDNMRCDAQMSAVFLSCMYNEEEDSDSSEDRDFFGCDDEDTQRECQENSRVNPGTDKDQSAGSVCDKENDSFSENNTQPDVVALSTADIIRQSTLPPWEARGPSENVQVTLGTKQFRSGQRLQDRVLEALEVAQKANAGVRNNAVRTHFGYYYDSEEEEALRPVLREEQFIANYYEPFGDTFASTARPPVMLGHGTGDEDEGADFFNEFNARESRQQQAAPPLEEAPIVSPTKMSAIGSLFTAMSSFEEDE